MYLFAFELGREKLLALAELAQVLPKTTNPIDATATVVIIESSFELDPALLEQVLGSTIKTGRVIKQWPGQPKGQDLIQTITDHIRQHGIRNFGISLFDPKQSVHNRNRLGIQVKRAARAAGMATRFVQSQDAVLSSVMVRDQLLPHGREFWIVETNKNSYLITTESVQDWQGWSLRDFGRPMRDARRGMLPPKLARTMINLAGLSTDSVLIDPFCGVGTVLQETLILGYQSVIGSDKDAAAIAATQTNLVWLKERFPSLGNWQLLTAPIEEVGSLLGSHSPISGIVTEADLGSPDFKKMAGADRVKEFVALANLYKSWLPALRDLVSPNGVLVLAYPLLTSPFTQLPMPEYAADAGWDIASFFPESWKVVPMINNLTEPVLAYARPEQIIGRNIIKLVRR